LIAGIALAVVLTYRGSGVINLSTGAIAMLGGYAFWALNAGKLATLPTAVALPLSLLFVLAVSAITEFAVYRPLRNASPLAKLVSSLGVLLIAQSAMILAFGVTPQPEPGILPTSVVHIFGAVVPVNRFILTGLVIVAAAGLAALYKWTRFGLATRAASENEAAAMLSGLSPNIISLTNTLLASLLAGAVGILAASITQLDPSTLPLQIIPALAAALIAAFTSFGIAVAASFGIAIMYSLLQYASAQSWFPQSGGVSLPGVTDLLAFLVIIIVLAVVIGLATAVSAVRVRGVSLAVVTLAGAVAIENFGFVNSTWGGGLAGSPVPEPAWFGLDLGPRAPFRGIDGNLPSPVFGWVVLICCVLLCVAVGYLRRGTLGQRMLAVRSNERAAAAAAINPRAVKLAAFGI